MVAVALRKQSTFEHPAQNREAVLARYHRLREISRMHHTKALDFLSKDAILHQARRLGLAVGRTLCCDNMEELTLAFDLAIHTAPVGRSRAIDRYAGSVQFAAGADEALVLEAMRHARFAVVAVERRHPSVGLVVTELFREGLSDPELRYWSILGYLNSAGKDAYKELTKIAGDKTIPLNHRARSCSCLHDCSA